MSPTVVQVLQSWRDAREYADPTVGRVLPVDVKIIVLSAGLIFLLALVLGVWKYRQVLISPEHRAHPYVDIAHRAALLYSFAALLVAVFVQLSVWPDVGEPDGGDGTWCSSSSSRSSATSPTV